MSYALKEINENVVTRPEEYVDACDTIYNARISQAADMICANLDKSPIVLLSGPSGSGKTTTAKKVEEELDRRGVYSHTVSMDDYFKTLDRKTAPRTADGEIDFESPLCVDMDLLNEHFAKLAAGEEIRIPYFMFARQKRSASRFTPMRLGKNEIAIFEGIHALNDSITDENPNAFKLFISAASDIEDNGEVLFRREWMRLIRRIVRDNNFRGADALLTLNMWGNVMHGEALYIQPFKYKADLTLDSSLPYEVPLMKQYALPLLNELVGKCSPIPEFDRIVNALEQFAVLEEKYVKPESLLREFIGGGIYEY